MIKWILLLICFTSMEIFAVHELPIGNSDKVLECVKPFLPENPTILEAGAYEGEDTIRFKKFWPNSVVHTFEPVPEAYCKLMQKTCYDVLEATGKQNEPLFKLATQLEKIALQDPYCIEKKLYPNVDFYSGITLSALDIPSNLFTVIFALSRTVGWVSHWLEMMNDPRHALYRPRQLYTGSVERDLDV